MAHEIVIPRLGWSMEEGTFVRWLKQDGELVRRGEALFELEGEKALQEIESVDEGILRIPPDAPQPGTVVAVGSVLGFLVAEGESLPESVAADMQGSAIAHARVVEDGWRRSHGDAPEAPQPTEESRNVVASPRARRIAKELGVDWTRLRGSGSKGRIRERDVRAARHERTPSAGQSSKGKRIPISNRRRIIAERMLASSRQTAPVTLTTKADPTSLIRLREQFRSEGSAHDLPSYQDLIVKLVAETLKRHPLLAGRLEDDALVLPDDDEIHIGVAVDTDEGLLVPVIRNVGSLSLAALAQQCREMIEQARTGRLSAAQMQGGVFTVTNLGAFGIDAFTPIINLPESAILGLGAIRPEPVVLEDGQMVARHQFTLSLTFDHRFIDGAPAARFLQDLVDAIANAKESK